jgi:D-sedoheptulose 7-phosphate isomerase
VVRKTLRVTPAPTFLQSLAELQAALDASRALAAQVEETSRLLIATLQRGGKVLTCGNGGSAADALHLSEELVGRYKAERRSLPAICLNADVTALTCIANDYGYDEIFARQVAGLGAAGDLLVAFSTSGKSPNVLAAFRRARDLGLATVLLGGKDGGPARDACHHALIVPSHTTARIQEIHTLILHQWLEAVEAVAWP